MIMAMNGGKAEEPSEGSEVISKKLLETAILSKEGCDVTVTHFTVEPGSVKGENFTSQVFAVNATTEDKGAEKIHNLFVKIAHSSEYVKEYTLRDCKLFFKEEMAYSQIIPDMIRYQTDRGIERFGPSVPTYYYSIANNETGIIILQDIRTLGYTLGNGKKGLDEEHCRLVMNELASFHALSFAMKQKHAGNLKQYNYLFHDGLFTTPLAPHLPEAWRSVIQLAHAFGKSEKAQEYVAKLQNFDFEKSMKNLIKPVEPYSLICHGDLWCNNMLFKYDEVDKDKPTDVKLLDLQMVRYALPTTDLAYFFFTSVSRATRKKYMTELLHIYHSAFMDRLRKLDLHFAEFTFPVFEKLFNDSTLFGVIVGLLLLPVFLLKPEAVPDMSAMTQAETAHVVGEFYNRIAEVEENIPLIEDRLIGTIADAVDLGII